MHVSSFVLFRFCFFHSFPSFISSFRLPIAAGFRSLAFNCFYYRNYATYGSLCFPHYHASSSSITLSLSPSLAFLQFLLCILTFAPSFVSNLHFLPAFSLCASALCTLIILFSASSQHFTRCLLFFLPQSLSCSSPSLLPSPFWLLPWSSFR